MNPGRFKLRVLCVLNFAPFALKRAMPKATNIKGPTKTPQHLANLDFTRKRPVFSGLKASTACKLHKTLNLLPESETWGRGGVGRRGKGSGIVTETQE